MQLRLAVHVIAGAMAALLLPTSSVAAQEFDPDEWLRKCEERNYDSDRYVECDVRVINLERRQQVRVDGGRNGGITVRAWDGQGIRVHALVTSWSPTQERASANLADITIATDPEIRASGPGTSGRDSWSVSYVLLVPRETDLDLSARNGGIRIAGVSGSIAAATTNGGLHLSDLAGDVRARTRNGGLEVRLAGSRWEGRGLDAETTNGGVHLYLPDRYSAELETGTVNGSVETEIPITVHGRFRRIMNVRLGDGGAPVRAVTRNGSVRLRQI